MMVSLLFLVTQAHAVTITFEGVTALQNGVDAGLTSGRSGIDNATNTVIEDNWFIETFDKPVLGGGFTGGFTTLDETELTIVNGIDFRQNSLTGVAAAPANDLTYFAYIPKALQPGQTTNVPASVFVPNTAFDAYAPGLYIDYMGLYFGSIDTYNTLYFYLLDQSVIELTGTYILSQYYGGLGTQYSGSWTDPASNVYVNLDFDLLAGEIFTSFMFYTDGVALEIDNIVTHVTNVVPEPSTFILLGAGLLGFVALGRKRFAQ